jgi:hypothetical protein
VAIFPDPVGLELGLGTVLPLLTAVFPAESLSPLRRDRKLVFGVD